MNLLKKYPNIKRSSAQNLLAGGIPMFTVIINAQKRVNIGNKFNLPFDKIIAREAVISYIILANINREALDKPWRNIIKIAPFTPASDPKNILEIKNLIWATEEYAIIAFRSLCWRQIKAVKTLPQALTDEIKTDNVNVFIIIISRKIPIPPSFKSTAARIIEPPNGASTWAFGNHKWKKNIGNFTKKAKIIMIHQKDLYSEE